jgi:hypothetical protein
MIIFLLLFIVSLISFGVALYESRHCIAREVADKELIAAIMFGIAVFSFCGLIAHVV